MSHIVGASGAMRHVYRPGPARRKNIARRFLAALIRSFT